MATGNVTRWRPRNPTEGPENRRYYNPANRPSHSPTPSSTPAARYNSAALRQSTRAAATSPSSSLNIAIGRSALA